MPKQLTQEEIDRLLAGGDQAQAEPQQPTVQRQTATEVAGAVGPRLLSPDEISDALSNLQPSNGAATPPPPPLAPSALSPVQRKSPTLPRPTVKTLPPPTLPVKPLDPADLEAVTNDAIADSGVTVEPKKDPLAGLFGLDDEPLQTDVPQQKPAVVPAGGKRLPTSHLKPATNRKLGALFTLPEAYWNPLSRSVVRGKPDDPVPVYPLYVYEGDTDRDLYGEALVFSREHPDSLPVIDLYEAARDFRKEGYVLPGSRPDERRPLRGEMAFRFLSDRITMSPVKSAFGLATAADNLLGWAARAPALWVAEARKKEGELSEQGYGHWEAFKKAYFDNPAAANRWADNYEKITRWLSESGPEDAAMPELWEFNKEDAANLIGSDPDSLGSRLTSFAFNVLDATSFLGAYATAKVVGAKISAIKAARLEELIAERAAASGLSAAEVASMMEKVREVTRGDAKAAEAFLARMDEIEEEMYTKATGRRALPPGAGQKALPNRPNVTDFTEQSLEARRARQAMKEAEEAARRKEASDAAVARRQAFVETEQGPFALGDNSNRTAAGDEILSPTWAEMDADGIRDEINRLGEAAARARELGDDYGEQQVIATMEMLDARATDLEITALPERYAESAFEDYEWYMNEKERLEALAEAAGRKVGPAAEDRVLGRLADLEAAYEDYLEPLMEGLGEMWGVEEILAGSDYLLLSREHRLKATGRPVKEMEADYAGKAYRTNILSGIGNYERVFAQPSNYYKFNMDELSDVEQQLVRYLWQFADDTSWEITKYGQKREFLSGSAALGETGYVVATAWNKALERALRARGEGATIITRDGPMDLTGLMTRRGKILSGGEEYFTKAGRDAKDALESAKTTVDKTLEDEVYNLKATYKTLAQYNAANRTKYTRWSQAAERSVMGKKNVQEAVALMKERYGTLRDFRKKTGETEAKSWLDVLSWEEKRGPEGFGGLFKEFVNDELGSIDVGRLREVAASLWDPTAMPEELTTDGARRFWESSMAARKQASRLPAGSQTAAERLRFHLLDRQGGMKVALRGTETEAGERAVQLNELVAGAPGRARLLADETASVVYRGLNRKQRLMFDGYVTAKRFVEVVENKAAEGFDFMLPTGQQLEESKAYLQSIRDAGLEKSFEARRKIYHQAFDDALDRMYRAGLIDSMELEALRAKGKFYTPMERLDKLDPMVEIPGHGRRRESMIEALSDVGSASAVNQDTELMLRQYLARAESLIARNEAKAQLYGLATEFPDNGVVKALSPFEKVPDGWEELTVKIAGQPFRMAMEAKYAREWVGAPPMLTRAGDLIARTFFGTNMLKFFATGSNVAFAIKNTFRDPILMLLSDARNDYSWFVPLALGQAARDAAAVLPDAIRGTGRARDYVMQGGDMAWRATQGRFSAQASGPLRKLSDAASWLGETSELTWRLAQRERAIRNGVPDELATYIARSRVDYHQGGQLVKAADTMFAYLNAGVQAGRAVVRSARQNPGLLAARLSQFLAAGAAIHLRNEYVNPEAMAQIPPHERKDNWIILPETLGLPPITYVNSDGQEVFRYFKIPKDQTIRGLAAAAEFAVDKIMGLDTKYDVDSIVEGVKDFMPVFPLNNMPPAISAWFAIMQNRDTYYKEDVWRGEEMDDYTLERRRDTAPAFQAYGDLMKRIGASGTPLASPVRMQHAVGEYVPQSLYPKLVGAGINALLFGDDEHPSPVGELSPMEKFFRQPEVRSLIGTTRPDWQAREDAEDRVRKAASERERVRQELRPFLDRAVEAQKLGPKAATTAEQEYLKAAARLIPETQIGWAVSRLRDAKRLATVSPELRSWWITTSKDNPESRAVAVWAKWYPLAAELKRAQKNNDGAAANAARLKLKELEGAVMLLPGIEGQRFINTFKEMKRRTYANGFEMTPAEIRQMTDLYPSGLDTMKPMVR